MTNDQCPNHEIQTTIRESGRTLVAQGGLIRRDVFLEITTVVPV